MSILYTIMRWLAGLVMLVCCQSVYAGMSIETWQTQNGVKVFYVYAPELPMVDIQFAVDAGSARDGADYGLASFTASMLGSGTSALSEAEVSDGFNRLGAQFGGQAGRDMATLSLRTLTRPEVLKPAVALFEAVVRDSHFSKAEFEREKARLLIGLQQRQTRPGEVADDALWQALYGSHPYGHAVSGTLQSVKSLTLEKVQAFYQQYYVAKNMQIAMVGRLSRAEAEQISEQLTQKIPVGKPLSPIDVPNLAQQKKGTVEIAFDATQTHYSLAQIGVARGDADYYALFLGNHLLGGSGFGSQLMEEVREKRGLVYGIYSYFLPMKVAGPFVIGLSTQNATAKQADAVVKETLVQFLKDFPQQKLQAMKDNLVGGFPLRIDSNAKKLGYLTLIGFYGLPLDYLEQFPQKIAGLTKEQVLKAWQKHIQPQSLYTQMVGMPK